MNHQELKNFILETYPASADHPWLQYPNYEVFRHHSNQKWFAVVMELSKVNSDCKARSEWTSST